MAPFDRVADQSPAFRADLKAQSKRRRERLSSLASAPPLRRRNDLLPPLVVEEVFLADLVSPARNVRRQEAAHIREVAASIAALGFCDPVLIGSGNTILDGAIRVEAAKQLGLLRISCVRVQHLTSVEQRLLRIASNRLAEKGVWNLEDLKIEFEELLVEQTPIEISGFGAPEIDQILLGDDSPPHEQGPLAPAPGAIAVARKGNIFRLGEHRIVCGDATIHEVFAPLMRGDGPARLVLTDEPYNVRISGNVTGGSHREFAMASGEMSGPEFLTFNLAWMKAALDCLADGGLFGTFIDWRGLPTVHAAATQLGVAPINLIVWAKANAGMGSLYRSQHELLPLFKKGKGDHLNNIDLGRKGRWRSNLWAYPGASSIGSDARKGLRDHPTVKPTALLADALLDVTARGDIVIDPFLGSGSTLIAAERAGRRCRGVEIDPLYVDVIVRRYQAETGREAILEATGETFAALAARGRDERTDGAGDKRLPDSADSLVTIENRFWPAIWGPLRPIGRRGIAENQSLSAPAFLAGGLESRWAIALPRMRPCASRFYGARRRGARSVRGLGHSGGLESWAHSIRHRIRASNSLELERCASPSVFKACRRPLATKERDGAQSDDRRARRADCC